MRLIELSLQNFRCFDKKKIIFDAPITIIEGCNGSGKTSLLEALHYACYLRSFRSHNPRVLLKEGTDTFVIKATVHDDTSHQQDFIHIGYSSEKRLVKINKKTIQTHKELIDHFRSVTLTEDDLALVQEGPEHRRGFLDQAITLEHPTFTQTMRTFRQIVDNRNTLLQKRPVDKELYAIWTKQLWQTTRIIQKQRILVLQDLLRRINAIAEQYFTMSLGITLVYRAKKKSDTQTLEEFLHAQPDLYEQECRFGRSLFGPHLDDFSIAYEERNSRSYASRGQQKLLALLLKIALLQRITQHKGPTLFLLDDFMTDFDAQRTEALLTVLADLKTQLIFTAPIHLPHFQDKLKDVGVQHISLTG